MEDRFEVRGHCFREVNVVSSLPETQQQKFGSRSCILKQNLQFSNLDACKQQILIRGYSFINGHGDYSLSENSDFRCNIDFNTKYFDEQSNRHLNGDKYDNRNHSNRSRKELMHASRLINMELLNNSTTNDISTIREPRREKEQKKFYEKVCSGNKEKEKVSLCRCDRLESHVKWMKRSLEDNRVPDIPKCPKHNPEGNHNSNNTNLSRASLANSLKYQFDAIESFVHFNNIYNKSHNKMIPALKGFPVHCVDTIRILMMLGMNKRQSHFKLQSNQQTMIDIC